MSVVIIEQYKNNQMDYTKTNRLIAEFMGCTFERVTITRKRFPQNETKRTEKVLGLMAFVPDWRPRSSSGTITGGNFKTLKGLRFRISWDWLMPVVEKIESLDYTVSFKCSRCLIQDHINYAFEVDTEDSFNSKIEAVYEAIIIFIGHYNSK